MLPPKNNDDNNVQIHLVDEIDMDTNSPNCNPTSCSNDDDLCLVIDASLDPDHEFHVVVVVLEHNCDCLSVFVPIFGGFAAEVNNTYCYDHFIWHC